MRAHIDHLVVLAASLQEGVDWCEATLGVTPGPGGEHPLMGTHNRLLRIATVNYPRAYLEIIAIAPGRPAPVPPRAARWFDMDDEAVQERLAQDGPRLAHLVANVDDVAQATAALAGLGIDRGPALRASRMSPRGLLQWQITVRDDGQRLFNGTLPTLIQWGDTHPIGGMPESGLTLQSLCAVHPQNDALGRAFDAIGLQGVTVQPGPPNLLARLGTPRGIITLESQGL
jgi:hypothetical protein